MSDTKKCAHALCSCTVDKDHKYCSESCEDSANNGMDSIGCDCKHPGCKGEL